MTRADIEAENITCIKANKNKPKDMSSESVVRQFEVIKQLDDKLKSSTKDYSKNF